MCLYNIVYNYTSTGYSKKRIWSIYLVENKIMG